MNTARHVLMSSVGGGTQDRAVITPSVEVYEDVFPAVPANYTSTKQLFPDANYVAVGKGFYLTSGNFPSGTQFIWGVDLMKNNVSEAKAQVQAIKDAFQVRRERLQPVPETLADSCRTLVCRMCDCSLLNLATSRTLGPTTGVRPTGLCCSTQTNSERFPAWLHNNGAQLA
jgi:hypothetical protein